MYLPRIVAIPLLTILYLLCVCTGIFLPGQYTIREDQRCSSINNTTSADCKLVTNYTFCLLETFSPLKWNPVRSVEWTNRRELVTPIRNFDLSVRTLITSICSGIPGLTELGDKDFNQQLS